MTNTDTIHNLCVLIDKLRIELNKQDDRIVALESEIKKLKGDDALNAILEELRRQKSPQIVVVPQPHFVPQPCPQTPEFPFYPNVTCALPTTATCDTTCNKKNPPECSCKDYTGGPA